MSELIKQYVGASAPQIERLFSLILFNYLFSNGDAHLKNFSLLETESKDFILSPAYDLLCTSIHVDDSDLGLKNGLYEKDIEHPSYSKYGFYAYDDFYDFGLKMGMRPIRIKSLLALYKSKKEEVIYLINMSFLNDKMKTIYLDMYLDKQRRFAMSVSGKI